LDNLDHAKVGPRGPAHGRRLLADKGVNSTSSPMSCTSWRKMASSRRDGCTNRKTVHRGWRGIRLPWPGDLTAAAALASGVSGALGVDQRELCHPLRRLPHDLEGDVAAHRMPGQRKRGGASARIRRAIAPMLLSRMWLATVTGPNCTGPGPRVRKSAGDDTSPGTSKIGIVLSMLVSGSSKNFVKTGCCAASPRLKAGAACQIGAKSM